MAESNTVSEQVIYSNKGTTVTIKANKRSKEEGIVLIDVKVVYAKLFYQLHTFVLDNSLLNFKLFTNELSGLYNKIESFEKLQTKQELEQWLVDNYPDNNLTEEQVQELFKSFNLSHKQDKEDAVDEGK